MYMIHPGGIEHGVVRLFDKAWIPNCEDNKDWKEYLKWVSEDNEPLSWEENFGE